MRRIDSLLIFVALVAVLRGCVEPGTSINTTSPDAEQVAYARDVMRISPRATITPLGLAIESGRDEFIQFKFRTTDDPRDGLFSAPHVDPAQFAPGMTLTDGFGGSWWDPERYVLDGGSFEIGSGGGMKVGFVADGAGWIVFCEVVR